MNQIRARLKSGSSWLGARPKDGQAAPGLICMRPNLMARGKTKGQLQSQMSFELLQASGGCEGRNCGNKFAQLWYIPPVTAPDS